MKRFNTQLTLTLTKSITNCPSALSFYLNCLSENNHNPNTVDEFVFCKMAMIELDCAESTFAANTACAGEQDAVDAARRIRPLFESICAAVHNAATFIASSFFTVIIVACLCLTQW